jgi:hypothetical protein
MAEKDLLVYLGQVGRAVPILPEKEWLKIFQFLEYFMAVELKGGHHIDLPDFDWNRVIEVLSLLGKVKD